MTTLADLDRRLRIVEIINQSNTNKLDAIIKTQLSSDKLIKYVITPLILIIGVLAGVKLIL